MASATRWQQCATTGPVTPTAEKPHCHTDGDCRAEATHGLQATAARVAAGNLLFSAAVATLPAHAIKNNAESLSSLEGNTVLPLSEMAATNAGYRMWSQLGPRQGRDAAAEN